MKSIQLNKGVLELPSKWDELNNDQKLYAFDLLYQVVEGSLSPLEFRIHMLASLTKYRPQSDLFCYLFHYCVFLLKVPFVTLWYFLKIKSIRFRDYLTIWKSSHRPKKRDRSIINFNLFRLSEQLDFAFTIENRKIQFNRDFDKNPIPVIKIKDKQYPGCKFNRDIAPFTDISARQFSDCFDLYTGYLQSDTKEVKDKCLNRIISILYPAYSDYNSNMVSNHADQVGKLSEGIKFGIIYWLSGIIDYYVTHPIYSLLFRSNQTDLEETPISLGMGEAILMLEKKGYENEESMNLNKFFDAQIAELKNNLATAVSKGVKLEDLANSTGLSINDINRLI